MGMKVTGREISEYESDDFDGEGRQPVFLTMGEVVITAGPKGLRKLADHLNWCAKQMEDGSEQDHYHFNGNTNDRPQIVIINKKIAKRIARERAEVHD